MPCQGDLYTSAALRGQLGAIDSLVWRDREFIKSCDHERKLQDYRECWNPTEAGGKRFDRIDFET